MDTGKIKEAAKAAGGMAYYPPQPYDEDRRYSDAEIAWLEFVNQASPVVVSELIAENEQLNAELECARGDLETAMEIIGRQKKAFEDVHDSIRREYWSEYAGLDGTREILDAAIDLSLESEID